MYNASSSLTLAPAANPRLGGVADPHGGCRQMCAATLTRTHRAGRRGQPVLSAIQSVLFPPPLPVSLARVPANVASPLKDPTPPPPPHRLCSSPLSPFPRLSRADARHQTVTPRPPEPAPRLTDTRSLKPTPPSDYSFCMFSIFNACWTPLSQVMVVQNARYVTCPLC